MGQMAVFAAGAFLIVSSVNPSHPMSCTHDYTWALPWIYVVYVFGFSIYLEHMLENVKDASVRDDVIKHLYFLGNSLVVTVLIGFYIVKLWHLTFGESTLSNADMAFPTTSNVNFAFNLNPRDPLQYAIS
jgi:hypothetical protein